MRPLRLTIQAIGPFLSKTVIDFDRIGAQALFLVHGQTGRGKSFIFDAMTFALYAETPAGREHHLRSDFAAPTVKPVVEFVFQLRDDIYKVTRELAYERPKRRGTGTTRELETHHLCQLTTWPEGTETTLASKKRTVDSQILQILGLDRAQFQQVMFLPQGEFRRLLLASSSDREHVLETLFDASLYQNIQDYMERICRAERKQNERLTQAIQHYSDQAREKLPPDLHPGKDEAPDNALIQKGIERLTSLITAASAVVAEKNKALQKANTEKQKAEQLISDHRQKSKLEGMLAEIEQQRPQTNVLTAEYRQAEVAEALRPASESQIRTTKQHTRAIKSAEESKNDLHTKKTVQKELAESAKQAPGLRKDASTRRQRLALLEPLVGAATGLHTLKTQVVAKEKEARQAEHRHAEAILTLETGRKKLASTQKAIEAIQAKRIDITPLEKRRTSLQEVTEQSVRAATFKEQATTAQNATQQAQSLLDKAEKKLLQLREAREANLAGELAATLEPTQACPVCGSTKHPQKASARADAPAKKAVASADLAFNRNRTACAEAQQVSTTAQTRADDIAAALAKLLVELSVTRENVPDELRAVAASLAAEDQRQKRAAKLDTELSQLRDKTIPGQEAKERAAFAALNNATAATGNAQAKLEQAQEHWAQTLDQDARQALGDAADSATAAQIQALIAELRTQAVKLDERAADLEEAANHAAKAEATATATLQEREKTRKLAAKELGDAEAAFIEALQLSPFESRNEFAAALRDAKWRSEAKSRLENFKQRARDAQVRLEETVKRIADRELPKLDAFQTATDQAQRDYEAAHTQQMGLEQSRTDLRSFLDNICKLKEESGDIIDRLRILGRLDRELRGQSQPRISLKRFFLAQRLDEVLIQASRRMHLLSNGRFTLKRAPGGQTQREQTGLDLLVVDSYTGTERPVNTLSGGQLFLASLSMALGLADVVQARSGGTRMDTLFIDEGFGSLDEETLQLAMKVLNELREGRMVGVISHVPELKRQIGTRIEVLEADTGSKITLTVEE